MSVTAPSVAVPAPRAGVWARALALAGSDRGVATLLAAAFAAIVALSWRRWGVPEIDAGAELTTADLVRHGSVLYGDVRYFYGPLGLYALAFWFKLFGASFSSVYAFGLLQAAGILGVFHVLARHWLRPVAAGLATAVLMAIGFSGTAFNFVLPHTNSATMGILCLLLCLLALAKRRLVPAGVAAGLVGLTRPEFEAVVAGVVLAYVVGLQRENGWRPAVGGALRLAVPAVAIPGAVLGAFAVKVGAANLFTENLWPVDFIRQAGFRTEASWMPFDAPSVVGLLARGAIYGGLLAALTASVVLWRRRPRSSWRAASPLAAAVLALLVLDVAARELGAFPVTRAAVEAECRHLVIGMSWLPAMAFAVAVWVGLRLLRRRPAPFSGSWAADLALTVAAFALGLRAYNAFTTESSYAPYYAAPLVLVAGILHQRIGDRWPAARPAALAALAAVACGLAAYAVVGLYGDDSAPVHTGRGTFMVQPDAAPALQAAVDALRRSDPARPVLAAPSDGGLYFMANRRPALHELMLLPGLLDSKTDERHAIAALQREHVTTAVIGARDFTPFGWSTFGADYNRTLGAWLRAHTVRSTTVGDLSHPAAGTYPSRGFALLTLRP